MPAPSVTSPLAALDDAELAGRILHRDESLRPPLAYACTLHPTMTGTLRVQ